MVNNRPTNYEDMASHRPLPKTNDNSEPCDRNQAPAPQYSNPRPDPDRSDLQDLAERSGSKSALHGHPGVHHVAPEPQYAFSQQKGLHTRSEGLRQHESDADVSAEPLHPATVADLARAKYSGDQQTGNQHKATGIGADLGRGSMTRPGQGRQSDNTLDTTSQF